MGTTSIYVHLSFCVSVNYACAFLRPLYAQHINMVYKAACCSMELKGGGWNRPHWIMIQGVGIVISTPYNPETPQHAAHFIEKGVVWCPPILNCDLGGSWAAFLEGVQWGQIQGGGVENLRAACGLCCLQYTIDSTQHIIITGIKGLLISCYSNSNFNIDLRFSLNIWYY